MESNIKGSKPEANLLTAWKAKSNSKMKYSFYAYTALREEYQQISKFFEEAVKNESMHSKSFYMTLYGPVPDTKTNIATLLKRSTMILFVFFLNMPE